ncbi:MAG: YcxB family protein [Clostridia bacterium]|nr:YcxB family protein [Clostridia bacterium]
MEPVAVNRITVTRDLFAESHEAIFSVKRQKTLLYCGIIFFVFGLILFAFRSRMQAAAGLYTMLLLTGAIVVIWSLTLKKTDFRKKYRAFQQKHGDASSRVITCDRTGLEVDTGKGEPVRIEYTDIQDHRETEHLYLLLCRGHTGVQLAKDGFQTGSWYALLKAVDRAKEEAAAMQELI